MLAMFTDLIDDSTFGKIAEQQVAAEQKAIPEVAEATLARQQLNGEDRAATRAEVH